MRSSASSTLSWILFLFLFSFIHESSSATDFVQPVTLRSVSGVLSATFIDGIATVTAAGQSAALQVYNSSYNGPTLRLSRGDILRLNFINNLDEDTNVHFHGLEVTPKKAGDNIFINIPKNGGTHQYKIKIPATHPQGLYWYHSHQMGESENQVMNGNVGMLVIEGILDQFPSLSGVKEVLFLLKDIQLISRGGVSVVNPVIATDRDTIRNVNGQVEPQLTIAPGETQFWRISNGSPDLFYLLSMQGVTFYEIAVDGVVRTRLVNTTQLLFAPGNRREVLVVGPPAGTYTLKTLLYEAGPIENYPEATLATLVSTGTAITTSVLPTADQFPTAIDLTTLPVDQTRTFTFSTTGTGIFSINDQVFDASRIDVNVTLGSLEKWTLVNIDPGSHVFHIHQVHFQVVSIEGVNQDFNGYVDTVVLPRTQPPRDTPTQVVVLLQFNNKAIVGETVMHCHILQHEERGMMQTVNVVRLAKK